MLCIWHVYHTNYTSVCSLGVKSVYNGIQYLHINFWLLGYLVLSHIFLLGSSKRRVSLSDNCYFQTPLLYEVYTSSVTSKSYFSLYYLISVIINKKFLYTFCCGLNCAPPTPTKKILEYNQNLETRSLQMQSNENLAIRADPNPIWLAFVKGKFGHRDWHAEMMGKCTENITWRWRVGVLQQQTKENQRLPANCQKQGGKRLPL